MTELLKQNLAAHISLAATEMEKFCNLFEHRTIKKKSFLDLKKFNYIFCKDDLNNGYN